MELCREVDGRDLFYGLKRTCEQNKALMIEVEVPTTVTNRIAMACASFSFGGNSLDNLAPWAASTADL